MVNAVWETGRPVPVKVPRVVVWLFIRGTEQPIVQRLAVQRCVKIVDHIIIRACDDQVIQSSANRGALPEACPGVRISAYRSCNIQLKQGAIMLLNSAPDIGLHSRLVRRPQLTVGCQRHEQSWSRCAWSGRIMPTVACYADFMAGRYERSCLTDLRTHRRCSHPHKQRRHRGVNITRAVQPVLPQHSPTQHAERRSLEQSSPHVVLRHSAAAVLAAVLACSVAQPADAFSKSGVAAGLGAEIATPLVHLA